MAVRRDIVLAIGQDFPWPGWPVFARSPCHAHYVLAGVRCYNGRQRYNLSAEEAMAFIEERLGHLLQIVAQLAGGGMERQAFPTLLPLPSP